MAKDMTKIRCGKKFRMAIGVQDVEGTPASSPIETLWAGDGEVAWGREKEEIPGSYGRIARPHYSVINASFAPTMTATIAITRKMLPVLLRSIYGKGVVSSYTETGDIDSELDTWVINGVVPYYNTDAARKLYADLTDAAGTRKVEIYKDAAKSNKVAEGTLVGDGTLTFTERNNSGISGTVDVTYSDGETDVVILVKQLKYQKMDNTYEKYLTLWYEDGERQYKHQDCQLRIARFLSVEKSHLRMELEFISRGIPVEDDAAPLSISSVFEVFCHKAFAFTKDPAASGSFTESGDTDDELDNWVLNGVVPYTNTDEDAKLYVKLTEPIAGDYKVEVFKDSAQTLKVAEGERTGNGTITLTEQNNSGISGTVDVTWTDGEAAVILLFQIEFGVREFSTGIEIEAEVFQGNSLYPLKLIKEAFVTVSGNMKSKYSNETKKLFENSTADPLVFEDLEGKWIVSGAYLTMRLGKVTFDKDSPPAFSESKFDDFDSDFSAYGPDAADTDPVVITVDLEDLTP